MKRLAISCAVALAVVAHGRLGVAQCKTDIDCKGDRICENARCVTPPTASAAPVAAATTAPTPRPAIKRPKPGPITAFGKGYLEFNVMIGIGSWGQKRVKSDDPNVQTLIEDNGVDSRSAGTGPYGGIYISPRWVASPNVHLGPYFRVGKGENVGVSIGAPDITGIDPYYDEDELDNIGHLHVGVGGSIKFGGMVGKRVWVGGGLDLGFHVTKSEESEAVFVLYYGGDTDDDEKYLGFEALPRFCVDIFLFNLNGFKMSIPISVGAAIVPYARWKPEDHDVEDAVDDDEVKAWIWQIEPVLMFGFAAGA
jgi:hypothetical protein